MNLDKVIANMRQNQAIYQMKADELYVETSLITNIFQSNRNGSNDNYQHSLSSVGHMHFIQSPLIGHTMGV